MPLTSVQPHVLAASELNAKLSGSAKALSCRVDDGQYKRVNHLYFLTDYACFFESSTDKNALFYSDPRIEKFE